MKLSKAQAAALPLIAKAQTDGNPVAANPAALRALGISPQCANALVSRNLVAMDDTYRLTVDGRAILAEMDGETPQASTEPAEPATEPTEPATAPPAPTEPTEDELSSTPAELVTEYKRQGYNERQARRLAVWTERADR